MERNADGPVTQPGQSQRFLPAWSAVQIGPGLPFLKKDNPMASKPTHEERLIALIAEMSNQIEDLQGQLDMLKRRVSYLEGNDRSGGSSPPLLYTEVNWETTLG